MGVRNEIKKMKNVILLYLYRVKMHALISKNIAFN